MDNLDGQWVLLEDDEDLDLARNRIIDVKGTRLTSSQGDIGTVEGLGDKWLLSISPHQRLVIEPEPVAAGWLEGMLYSSSDGLPEGDPGELWVALRDADDDDPRHDELPLAAWCRLIREADARGAVSQGDGGGRRRRDEVKDGVED